MEFNKTDKDLKQMSDDELFEYLDGSCTLEFAIEEIKKLRKEFWENAAVPGNENGPNSELEKAGRLADYLEIAEVYKVIFISNLYQCDDKHNDIVRRFINLIDILYDYNVKLIIQSDVDIPDIYTGQALKFEFKRTISRLNEMQSEQYLSKVHL